MFKTLRAYSAWNAKYPGTKAFTALTKHGHKHGSIFNKNYMAHRVAWTIYYGCPPSLEIDHINGNPRDNRIKNLREVDRATNSRNAKKQSRSSRPYPGVFKAGRRWRARIMVNYREISLGGYATQEEAINAKKAAEREHGFHENHGRKQK